MKLYIIGNGFDRAHNLPTSYWDFREYLSTHYPMFLDSFESHYAVSPGSALLWNELESNLANIAEDIIIEDATSFDVGAESGDVGIEDTLYHYFSDEYGHIEQMAQYLKQWIRTVRIRDLHPKAAPLIKNNEDFFVTFNYTGVLERTYEIPPAHIIHIHGSLHENDIDPVLGHGNSSCIANIKSLLAQAQDQFDEKLTSICRVLSEYYDRTYKHTDRYSFKLLPLAEETFDEIVVIGHSLSGVDLPYFKLIDELTAHSLVWRIYYFAPLKKEEMANNLVQCGVSPERIILIPSSEFYSL